jgi:ketosteroid isomerase-like protein
VSGTIEGISGTYDREQFGALLRSVKDAYRTGALRIIPTEMTAEGSRVAVEAESYGELKNGRVYNCLYHLLFIVTEGRIVAVKEYLDTKHLFDVFIGP